MLSWASQTTPLATGERDGRFLIETTLNYVGTPGTSLIVCLLECIGTTLTLLLTLFLCSWEGLDSNRQTNRIQAICFRIRINDLVRRVPAAAPAAAAATSREANHVSILA